MIRLHCRHFPRSFSNVLQLLLLTGNYALRNVYVKAKSNHLKKFEILNRIK